MRREFLPGLLVGIFGFAGGLSMMAAPVFLPSILLRHAGQLFWGGLVVALLSLIASILLGMRDARASGGGGKGGDAKVGGSGVAIAGHGGGGGPGGRGGDGGSASTRGDGIGIGGDGGEAGQETRGGKGGRSSLERLEELGLGTEGTRAIAIIGRLREEYLLSHDNLSPGLLAGTENLPEEWVNARLAVLGYAWRVKNTATGLMIVSGR